LVPSRIVAGGDVVGRDLWKVNQIVRELEMPVERIKKKTKITLTIELDEMSMPDALEKAKDILEDIENDEGRPVNAVLTTEDGSITIPLTGVEDEEDD
jgi:hypothetical protein